MNNQLMNSQSKKIVAIVIFYAIAISLRYYTNIIEPDFLSDLNPYLRIVITALGPFIGGLVVIRFLNRPNFLTLFGLGIWKTVAIIAIPMVLFSLAWVLETGTFSINLVKVIGALMLYALLEEYGWRGYLQSELSGMKRIFKYLIITVLWFVWHLDFTLSLDNLLFFLLLFGGSYGIGFMADRSKSLIMVALFHSFSNIAQSGLLSEVSLNYKLAIIAISALSAIFIMRYDNKKDAIAIDVETKY